MRKSTPFPALGALGVFTIPSCTFMAHSTSVRVPAHIASA